MIVYDFSPLEKSGTYNRGVLKLLNVNPITPIILIVSLMTDGVYRQAGILTPGLYKNIIGILEVIDP